MLDSLAEVGRSRVGLEVGCSGRIDSIHSSSGGSVGVGVWSFCWLIFRPGRQTRRGPGSCGFVCLSSGRDYLSLDLLKISIVETSEHKKIDASYRAFEEDVLDGEEFVGGYYEVDG